MKAYKISDNGICRNNFKFEVGKTYKQKGELELCKNGFHFCKKIDSLFTWYSYKPNKTVIFEVEVLGDVIDDDNKSVTNKLKILRIIPFEEYNSLFSDINFEDKYHFHYKNIYLQKWKEYDSNGNLIHSKNSNGYEEWCKYNNNGNIIYFKDSNGYEEWHKYDNNANIIYSKDSDGYEKWYKYDNNGNIFYSKD